MSADVFPPKYAFDGYADEALEKAVGLRFVEPERKKMNRLQDELGRIASSFGGNAPDINTPRKGLLSERLSDHQKNVLNAVLWPTYAETYAEQQNSLLDTIIGETNEKMVELFKVLWGREAWFTYSKVPIHPACGPYANRQRIFFMRREVAHNVASVFRALNSADLMAHLEDCWRPPEVQEGLFIRRVIEVARWNPSWPWERVKMVASSLTAPAPGFAGHQAGAAVDWVIRKKTQDQDFLDSGVVYPEGSAVSCERFPYLTFEQFRTRVIFLFCAGMGGFKTLPTESWHISLGDRGMVEGKVPLKRAVYGPIKSFNRDTGEVDPYPAGRLNNWFLNDQEISSLVALSRRMKDEHSFALDMDGMLERFSVLRHK